MGTRTQCSARRRTRRSFIDGTATRCTATNTTMQASRTSKCAARYSRANAAQLGPDALMRAGSLRVDHELKCRSKKRCGSVVS